MLPADRSMFFELTLPKVIKICLTTGNEWPEENKVPKFCEGANFSYSFSLRQLLCIVACRFLCLFRDLNSTYFRYQPTYPARLPENWHYLINQSYSVLSIFSNKINRLPFSFCRYYTSSQIKQFHGEVGI